MPAKPNETVVDSRLVAPSSTHAAGFGRHRSTWNVPAPRSTYTRACVKLAAARIFPICVALERFRASLFRFIAFSVVRVNGSTNAAVVTTTAM